MKTYAANLAVVTGGATGMGRELVCQLAAEGCHVATCDLTVEALGDTLVAAQSVAPPGTIITAHAANVGRDDDVVAFAAEVARQHGVSHINLLFNNAGIGGGGSFVSDSRNEWETTFNVCWGGVYRTTRAFMPMLLASTSGHVVNTSSVNGFWASLGVNTPHSAYSAAKFAVKGFTESLITDFRVNAPHLQASVVMPGHIGTSIVINSMKTFGREPQQLDDDQISEVRQRMARRDVDLAGVSDADIRSGMQAMADGFRDNAPMSAAQAATVIIAGVRRGDWRILVGDDAHTLDAFVREDPDGAYESSFTQKVRAAGLFGFAL